MSFIFFYIVLGQTLMNMYIERRECEAFQTLELHMEVKRRINEEIDFVNNLNIFIETFILFERPHMDHMDIQASDIIHLSCKVEHIYKEFY